MSGFLGGMIAGAVTVLAVGAYFSLTSPLPVRTNVAVSAQQVAPASEPETNSDVSDPGADADLVELAPHAPQSAKSRPDTLAALDEADTVPTERPDVGAATDGLTQPDSGRSETVEIAAVAPIAPAQPGPAPKSPQDDVQPVVVDDEPATPSISEAVVVPEPETQIETEQRAPEIALQTDEESATPQSKAADSSEGRTLPRLAALPQIGDEQSSQTRKIAGKRVVPLTDRDDFPSGAEQSLAAKKPIEAFAASFDNPDDKPLMSIVLIDFEGAFGAEALQGFPYPLSFAVSPTDPEAAEKMARYRSAGFEVLALADLPEAASAQDAETSLSVWLDALPETVGILEGVNTGIQGNRQLADHVAAIAGGTGRGLLTQNNGLNTVQKLAARSGIPASVVFRDFDGAQQDAKVMRRFLDQAAFRAGQEGAVVMLGRVQPETISALLLWGLEDRSSRVAMAPISAVLMNEIQ